MKKLLFIGVLLLSLCGVSSAQNMDIEIKDASLFDVASMIFISKGTSYIVGEEAKKVNIASLSYKAVTWDSALRNLSQDYNYRFSRNATGTYVFDPRYQVVTRTNFQLRPRTTDSNTFQLIKINHVYAGGLARMFADATVIPTEIFVVPQQSNKNESFGQASTINNFRR